MSARISVIIPVYNAEKYLPVCLDSLIAQSYQNLEIICINDCSGDASLDILNEYAKKDARIIVLTQDHNQGAPAAREAGLRRVTGDYLYFCDADDWIDPDYLAFMVQKLEEGGTDIVVNKSVIRETESASKIMAFPGQEKIPVNTRIAAPANVENIFDVLWNRLIKMDFWRKHDFHFPAVARTWADDMFMQYVTFGETEQIFFTEGPAYHYRDITSSIMNANKNMVAYTLTSFKAIYHYYAEHHLLDKGIKIYGTMPNFNVSGPEEYALYKDYFSLVIDYLNSQPTVYSAMDFYFANNILSTASYEDYMTKYPANAVISYIRRKK